MLPYEKLIVYQKVSMVGTEISKMLISSCAVPPHLKNQLERASSSVVLNIAEGAGKQSEKDRKNYFSVARSSVFESTAILKMLLNSDVITLEVYSYYYSKYDEISKMLYSLMRKSIQT